MSSPRLHASPQVRAKLNESATKVFTQVFCALPLGCVLGGKVFVVHGGLFSSDDVKVADLKAINRFREPPDEGPFCEMLWSDPAPGTGRSPSKRGVGVAFGEDVTRAFLERNGLELLVRSHEVKDEGFEVDHGGCCITVFSAPNYCDQMGNKGAFIRFENDMVPHMTSFSCVVRGGGRREGGGMEKWKRCDRKGQGRNAEWGRGQTRGKLQRMKARAAAWEGTVALPEPSSVLLSSTVYSQTRLPYPRPLIPHRSRTRRSALWRTHPASCRSCDERVVGGEAGGFAGAKDAAARILREVARGTGRGGFAAAQRKKLLAAAMCVLSPEDPEHHDENERRRRQRHHHHY